MLRGCAERCATSVGEPNPAAHLTPQNNQLMSKCRVLCFKPPLRLEQQGQDGQNEAEQCKHYALTLGDSFSRSMGFSVHTGIVTADDKPPSEDLASAKVENYAKGGTVSYF
jgi:hypothetical protein